MPGMRLCILDNDELDPLMVPAYGSYAAMFERLLRAAGWQGAVEEFQARRGQLPGLQAGHDAVLLTGSRCDAFSDEDWVVALRRHVEGLLRQGTPLVGVCFGHQLIAHCLGARVQRAPQGWGSGRMVYDWHAPQCLPPQGDAVRNRVALLASHQDQVLTLPQGATLLGAADPIATMNEHEVSLLARQGGISADRDAVSKHSSAIEANTALLREAGITSVPYLHHVRQDGSVVAQAGSMDTAALAALLGLTAP